MAVIFAVVYTKGLREFSRIAIGEIVGKTSIFKFWYRTTWTCIIFKVRWCISYEQLVKDRILDVLGMNDTKIALSQNETNYRFPVGHLGGKEIITPRIPTILADSGAFRSTAPDMLKYVSANLGLIHTKLDDAMQLGHLIRHSSIIANPMNYSEYRGLGWRVLLTLDRKDYSYWSNQWLERFCRLYTYQTGRRYSYV